MSLIETLSISTPVARKEHLCWHCYRPIVRGQRYERATYKYDDVYTIKSHQDCNSASHWYFRFVDYCVLDGFPPLWDAFAEDDPQLSIDLIRGRFPHVACRLEFHLQRAAQ